MQQQQSTARAITGAQIQQWCGSANSAKGKGYWAAKLVLECVPDPLDPNRYQAVVQGTRRYTVQLAFEGKRFLGTCSCPAYASQGQCKHVAAVLWYLSSPYPLTAQSPHSAVAPPPDPSPVPVPQLVVAAPVAAPPPGWPPTAAPVERKRLVEVFRNPSEPRRRAISVQRKEPMSVQFGIKIASPSWANTTVCVDLKIGQKRLYVVQRIGEFFNKIETNSPHAFSSRFVWDPSVHEFSPADQEVLAILRKIHQLESHYVRPGYGYRYSGNSRDRDLMIPAQSWPDLSPLLAGVDSLIAEGASAWPLTWANEPLPISTTIADSGSDDGYVAKIEGLTSVIPAVGYGFAAIQGTLYPMDEESLDQLHRLKKLTGSQPTLELALPREDFDTALNRVLPQLKKLSRVDIDPKLASEIVDHPLIRRLYLDRRDDRLAARVEFCYGDVTIDPLSSVAAEATGFVVRDLASEQELTEMLQVAGFERAGGRAFELEDEEAIYQFLFGALAEIEQDVEIYATPAVDPLIRRRLSRPKTRLDLDAQEDWLEVSFEVDDLDDQEIRLLLASIIEKRRFHRLRDGSFISLESPAYQEMAELLDELGTTKRELTGAQLRVDRVRALSLSERDRADAQVRWGKSLRRWLDNLQHPQNLEFALPESLQLVLRDYQRFGFEWMKTLAAYGFGGILADDMGLGKTLQSIAFLLSEREAGPFANPALIVCPASLVYNWQSEIEKFAPDLRSAVVAGDKSERDHVLQSMSDYDVLITSYPLLRRDLEHYQRPLYALILDEAQFIKNHSTQTAKAVGELVSPRRFALTGTPVENSIEDLWSIFHAVFPELFAHKKAFQGMDPEEVARRVRPFVLRRLKSDVLKELPDKIETLETSELAPDQKKLYMAYLAKLQKQTVDDLSGESFHKSRFKILAGLTRLRQICCHPALFMENYEGESGKLEQLMELVEECLAGDKHLLIFSQFTSMLAIIREKIDARGWSSFYLDGSTPSEERLHLCDRFNRGERPLFLISLKAGGTGLNLIGADTVVLYDLWWNPAVEAQATDRAHRIGQKKVVQVIRMLSRGTIEEKIYQLQQKKRDLIDRVVEANSEGLEGLSESDVRELLSL